jgi:hypothetical protein
MPWIDSETLLWRLLLPEDRTKLSSSSRIEVQKGFEGMTRSAKELSKRSFEKISKECVDPPLGPICKDWNSALFLVQSKLMYATFY